MLHNFALSLCMDILGVAILIEGKWQHRSFVHFIHKPEVGFSDWQAMAQSSITPSQRQCKHVKYANSWWNIAVVLLRMHKHIVSSPHNFDKHLKSVLYKQLIKFNSNENFWMPWLYWCTNTIYYESHHRPSRSQTCRIWRWIMIHHGCGRHTRVGEGGAIRTT